MPKKKTSKTPSAPAVDRAALCSPSDIATLEKLLKAMKPGPYEFIELGGNQVIAAECTETTYRGIAALFGLSSMENEFRAIVALLNAAPKLLAAAKMANDPAMPTASVERPLT